MRLQSNPQQWLWDGVQWRQTRCAEGVRGAALVSWGRLYVCGGSEVYRVVGTGKIDDVYRNHSCAKTLQPSCTHAAAQQVLALVCPVAAVYAGSTRRMGATQAATMTLLMMTCRC